MLVSGGKHSGDAPFKVIVGHGAFVMPMFRKVEYLSLALEEAQVEEQCVTKQGISLDVQAVIAFKVGNDSDSITNAGIRFLSDQNQMAVLTGRIFAGHLRSIVGSMTVEEIVTQRQRLAEEVLDASKSEMVKIGLIVDSFQIKSIDDMRSGYIEAMAAPNRAAIKRAAAVAQSEADRAAAEAQQASTQKQAEYQRDTATAQAQFARDTQTAQAQAAAALAVAQAEAQRSQTEAQQASQAKQADYMRATQVVQAQAKAAVDKAQAEADQAGPLAAASAQLAVTNAQAELAKQQAALREQQLIAEVVRPAEAEAQKTAILAKAEADKARIMAEAAGAANRISLDQALIEQLPKIVEAAANGLSGANLTVLNGADGMADITASLVKQGMEIFNVIRGSMPGNATVNGSAPAIDAPTHH